MKNLTTAFILILVLFICHAGILIISGTILSENENKAPIQPSVVVIDCTNFELAVKKIKEGEGFRSEIYQLDGNNYIGYGYQVPKDYIKTITEKEADSLLRDILIKKIEYVSREYELYGNQALALGMLYYACKPSSIKKSRLHKQLKSENPDYEIVQDSWESFCYFKGKKNNRMQDRRKFEYKLFKN